MQKLSSNSRELKLATDVMEKILNDPSIDSVEKIKYYIKSTLAKIRNSENNTDYWFNKN